MANATVGFDMAAKGWTSRFSYLPDAIISLNNKFYTLEQGRLWHHSHELAQMNTFYDVHYDSTITFVFNVEPSVVKTFRAISLEGTGDWSAEMKTNLEEGEIDSGYFIDKEGKKFAWIRGDGNTLIEVDYAASSVVGIGEVSSIENITVSDVDYTAFVFSNPIPPSISDGDVLWLLEDDNGTPKPAAVRIWSTTGGDFDDDITGENYVLIASSDTGIVRYQVSGTDETVDIQEPVVGDFLFAVKNNTVETSGILGFYNEVTLTNSDAELVELFAVNAEVTQSS